MPLITVDGHEGQVLLVLPPGTARPWLLSKWAFVASLVLCSQWFWLMWVQCAVPGKRVVVCKRVAAAAEAAPGEAAAAEGVAWGYPDPSNQDAGFTSGAAMMDAQQETFPLLLMPAPAAAIIQMQPLGTQHPAYSSSNPDDSAVVVITGQAGEDDDEGARLLASGTTMHIHSA